VCDWEVIGLADWSDAEVAATLDVYFSMLEMDLLDRPFNKSEMNKRLAGRLGSRSHKAVEFKHQNISYVLIQAGWPYVRGYKPASHIQKSLIDAVAFYLLSRPDLEAFVRAAVLPSAERTYLPSQDPQLVAAPSVPAPISNWSPDATGIIRDYLRAHESNKSLGLAGELAALEFERRRLAKEPKLRSRIEHTSVEHGDGAGFDIRSFELDGSPRLIEVKTTAYSELTPFYFSAGELGASRHYNAEYHVYRLFNFPKRPGLYMLSGPLDESTNMVPTSFSALPR